jgi:TQXA domain-containing protein
MVVLLAVTVVCSIPNTIYAIEQDPLPETGMQDDLEEAQESVLNCPLIIHKHEASCYDADEKLICGYADFVVHTHDEKCYDSDGNLVCELPEVENHTHNEECYSETEALICEKEELHTHEDVCYDGYETLICEKREVKEHQHTEACFQNEALESELSEAQKDETEDGETVSETLNIEETESAETETEPEIEIELGSVKITAATQLAALSSVPYYTVDGNVAFSLNKKRTATGANYTVAYTNPTNDQVNALCDSRYNYGFPYYDKYTANCILWCANYYNSYGISLARSLGISEANLWESLHQAVQYAIWYYTDSISLSKKATDPVEKLAYQIMDKAWDASGSAPGYSNGVWYKPDSTSAPNLLTMNYNTGMYIGRRDDYIADGGTISDCITIQQNGGDTQIGFCYDPAEANPAGDWYWYAGEIKDATIRKMIYNGYPHNKELLKTGISVHDLWYQTQRAIWNYRNGQKWEGDLYELLIGAKTSFTKNGVTITMKDPPANFVVYLYKASNRQGIAVGYGDDETEETSKSLTLTKSVRGNLSDTNIGFSFKIQLTDGTSKPLSGSYPVSAGTLEGTNATVPDISSLAFDANGEATVYLKHGQTITLEDLPADYGYQITELEAADSYYTTEITATGNAVIDNSGRTVKNLSNNEAATTVDYVNTRETVVPTGIRSNLIPLMAACILTILAVAIWFMYAEKELRRASK